MADFIKTLEACRLDPPHLLCYACSRGDIDSWEPKKAPAAKKPSRHAGRRPPKVPPGSMESASLQEASSGSKRQQPDRKAGRADSGEKGTQPHEEAAARHPNTEPLEKAS